MALTMSACGSSSNKKSSSGSSGGSTLKITVGEAGKSAKFTVPKSAKGGLTTITVTNSGKAPHGAQLVQLLGNHGPPDVMKALSPSNHAKNEWLRAVGGIGQIAPGGTASATATLKPGHYMVLDAISNGRPAFAAFTVKAGASGSLPTTSTTVTAAPAGKDRYRWKISGPLTAGHSNVTFVSKGKDTLHFVQAVRLTGKASKAQILKALSSQGKPPKFVDQKSFYTSSILDSGKSEVTPLSFSKPGKWILFCGMTDRGERKEHFKEGLLKVVTVK